VHLQQHARLEARGLQGARHTDHRATDDVGGRALDRSVDRGALSELAVRNVARADLGNIDLPSKEGGDEAVFAHLRRPGPYSADAWKAVE